MEETAYWAHLAAIEGIGGAIFDQLQKRFGSIKRAFEAPLDEVLDIPGLDARSAEAICRAGQTLKATEEKLKELAGRGVKVITKMESEYPPRLREAVNPPPVIYQMGKLQPDDNKAVAIIGSRECSEVSAKRSRDYAKYFAEKGIAVVSGYAVGVDINAHIGTIEGGGRTVIIPGCGVDMLDIEPFDVIDIHSREKLLDSAVVISEQPPDGEWTARASLARNRLVAAHASVVIVMEARLHSSTLDTVSRAQKLGRPVFVQNFGTISERVMGNEKLHKEGVVMIQDAGDLDEIVKIIEGSDTTGKSKKRVDDLRR